MPDRDPREVARVLADRARQLAAPPPPPPPEAVELLVFTRGPHRLAVPADAVAEVLPPSTLTLLPGGPPAVAGLRAVRGGVVVVADPARLLGTAIPPEDPPPEGAPVVVLHDRAAPLGLLADTVDEVTTTTRPGPHPGEDVVAGVTADGTVVLDVPAVLRDPRTATSGPSTPAPTAPTAPQERHP